MILTQNFQHKFLSNKVPKIKKILTKIKILKTKKNPPNKKNNKIKIQLIFKINQITNSLIKKMQN